jgi:predicted adenylyl cyclase CyaB
MMSGMALEIELKIRVDDLDAVRSKLQSLGGHLLVRLAEVNLFLDTPELSLRKADSGLRIRVETDRDTGLSRGVIITHKGPRLAGAVKSREETELRADSLEAAQALLERLGYRPTLRFEKHRDRWELAGCHIELDTVPLLGCFVEIEGPDEATILELRNKIGLGDQPLEPAGYAAMLGRELEARGSSSWDVRF